MTLDVGINNDNDISVSMTMGIDDQYMSTLGASDLCSYITENGGTGGMGLPGNVSLTPGTSNGQHTCTMSASGLKLSDVNSTDASGTGMSLTHDNGQYTFSMSMGDTSDLSGMSASDISQYINPFAISVTFPGAVVSSNPAGTVSGNKVTWDDPADLLGSTPLTAVGQDAAAPGQSNPGSAPGSTGSGSGSATPWGLIIGIVAGVIVIAAIIVIVLMSSKRKKAQAAAAMQAAYAQQYGQGPYGQPYPGEQYPTMPQYAPQPPYGQPMPDYTQPPAPQPVQYPPAAQYAAPVPVQPIPPQAAPYPQQYAQPAAQPVPQPIDPPAAPPVDPPAAPPVDPPAAPPVDPPAAPPVDAYQPPVDVPQPPADVYQPATHAEPDPIISPDPNAQPPIPPATPPAQPYGQ